MLPSEFEFQPEQRPENDKNAPGGEPPIHFTREELAEMIADNITLDDAIRTIEELR
jgi:hypothetical protein